MIKSLREEGVDVIPLKFAPCYRYGGGLNCFTLDVCRDGSMKNYFPTLDHLEESNKMDIDVSSAAADDELPSKRPRIERRASLNFD